MVFFLLACEKIPVPDVFFCDHSLFFIPNITAICRNKIPPSSEPEMISKELENSHLSYFSVNVIDIFRIIENYVGKLSPSIKKLYLSPSGNQQSCS